MTKFAAHPAMLALCMVLFSSAGAVDGTATITGQARTVDGDGLKIGRVTIRLHGIDAPEARQCCPRSSGGTWLCGADATRRLGELIEGLTVTCDARDQDGYGRIISACRADGVELEQVLVREGLAWAYREYSDTYSDLEDEARSAGLGIWQAAA